MESADALGFSVDTIRRRIQSKDLSAFKLPGNGPNEDYRIGEKEIEAFKKRNME